MAATAGDDEAQLLALARAGDRAAFGELLRGHDEVLRRLAWRLLHDRDLMDDVLQDAYVKAWRALPSFRGRSAFGTWLYRIAYRACLDELRRPHHARVVALHAERDVESPGPGLADTAVDRAALSAALDALPPDQRAAVLLVDAEGASYDEAAEVLGVASGTVASRLSRARAALRRALADDDDGGRP